MFAVASTFTTTDPYDANDTLSQAMAKSFYEGLFGFDKDMKLIPVLAESYKVSADGLVYTIKLRPGIKFQDGTDFNAEAVKINFDRVTNPDNKLKRYGLYSVIAKTEVVDAHTARITLKEPFSAFINDLAHPSGVMISPAALKQWGSKGIAFHPVGTGPFKFVEWKQPDYLKVEKFDGYWRKGYPKVDSITWRSVVDNNSRAALMQTGAAQFTFPVPYELAGVLRARHDLVLVAAPSIVLRYLSMNTQQKPFDNLKVREAIAYAINKEALAKVAFSGYAIPADGVVPDAVEYSVEARPVALRRREGEAAARRGRVSERVRDRTVVGIQLQHRTESLGIPAAATAADWHSDQDHAAGSRAAGTEGRELAGSENCAGTPVLHRLVVVDGRSRLGAAPAARQRLMAAKALQHCVLPQRQGRRRYQGALATTDKAQKAHALPRRATANLARRAVGATCHRGAAVCTQHEARRRLRDARRLVQFHRHQPEVTSRRDDGPVRCQAAPRPAADAASGRLTRFPVRASLAR